MSCHPAIQPHHLELLIDTTTMELNIGDHVHAKVVLLIIFLALKSFRMTAIPKLIAEGD
jgi:hypothetical protein